MVRKGLNCCKVIRMSGWRIASQEDCLRKSKCRDFQTRAKECWLNRLISLFFRPFWSCRAKFKPGKGTSHSFRKWRLVNPLVVSSTRLSIPKWRGIIFGERNWNCPWFMTRGEHSEAWIFEFLLAFEFPFWVEKFHFSFGRSWNLTFTSEFPNSLFFTNDCTHN